MIGLTVAFCAACSWPVLADHNQNANYASLDQLAPQGPGATGRFVAWTDGKVYDPDGNEFVYRGINIFPTQVGASHTNGIINCWGFNGVFINLNSKFFTLDQVRTAIDVYTALNLVAIVRPNGKADILDPATRQATLSDLTALAKEYSHNPLLWLATWNEPLGRMQAITYDSNGVPSWNLPNIQVWIDYNRQAIQAIRDAGVQSPIYVNGVAFGQDRLADQNNLPVYDRPWNELSSILKFGSQIQQGFSNIVFGMSAFRYWWSNLAFDSAEGRAQAALEWSEFFAAARAQGKAIIVGQHGSHASGAATIHNMNATLALYDRREAGDVFGDAPWHWQQHARERFRLVDGPDGSDGGTNINSCTNPTNLTEFGQALWDDLHRYARTGRQGRAE